MVIYSLLACLACKWLHIGTTMLLIITSTDDKLLTNVNMDDLEWPWTLKILILSDFFEIFGCKRVNCDKMDGDRPRLPANRNCHRLSHLSWALAQISCYSFSPSFCPIFITLPSLFFILFFLHYLFSFPFLFPPHRIPFSPPSFPGALSPVRGSVGVL